MVARRRGSKITRERGHSLTRMRERKVVWKRRGGVRVPDHVRDVAIVTLACLGAGAEGVLQHPGPDKPLRRRLEEHVAAALLGLAHRGSAATLHAIGSM